MSRASSQDSFLGVVAFAPRCCPGCHGVQPGVAQLCSGVGGAQKLFLGIHEQVGSRIRPKLIPESRGLLPVLLEMLGPQTSPLEGGERVSGQKNARVDWGPCRGEGVSVGPVVLGAGGARGAGAAGPASFPPRRAGRWDIPRAAVRPRADPGSLSATASPGVLVQGSVVPWLPAG